MKGCGSGRAAVLGAASVSLASRSGALWAVERNESSANDTEKVLQYAPSASGRSEHLIISEHGQVSMAK